MGSVVKEGENKLMAVFRNFLIIFALVLLFGSNAFMSVRGLMTFAPKALYLALCVGTGFEIAKLCFFIQFHSSESPLKVNKLFIIVAALLTAGTLLKVYCSWSQYYGESTEGLEIIETALNGLQKEEASKREQMERIDLDVAGLPRNYGSKKKQLKEEYGYFRFQAELNETLKQQKELRQQRISEKNKAGVLVTLARDWGLDEKLVIKSYNLYICILSELTVFALSGLVAGRNKKATLAKKMLSGGLNKTLLNVPEKQHKASLEKSRLNFTSQNMTIDHSKKPQKTTNDNIRNESFRSICDQHSLTADKVKKIIGCKKTVTTENWMTGKKVIPDKAFRTMVKWAKAKERYPHSSVELISSVEKIEKGDRLNKDKWMHMGPQRNVSIN